jgi:hypothetical protein
VKRNPLYVVGYCLEIENQKGERTSCNFKNTVDTLAYLSQTGSTMFYEFNLQHRVTWHEIRTNYFTLKTVST